MLDRVRPGALSIDRIVTASLTSPVLLSSIGHPNVSQVFRKPRNCRRYGDNSLASSATSSSSSGSGQPMPAAVARFKHNCTVEREQPVATAIFLSLTPAALSRSTSRILRAGNLVCDTDDLLPKRKRDHGSRGLPASHYGPTCSGIMDRHGPERWPDIIRNAGPTWPGTRCRPGPEYAADLASPCRLFGSLLRAFAILCTQQRCSRVSG